MKDSLDKFIATVNKYYTPPGGKPVAAKGNNITPINFIPCSSPVIGYLLETGGWPEGKFVEIYGKPGVGKSTMALMALKDCWEYYNGERWCLWVDMEGRFNRDWAIRLGFPVDDALVVVTPKSGEEAFDVILEAVKTGECAGFVLDSVGAIAPDYATGFFRDNKTRQGGAAAVISRGVNSIAPACNVYNTTGFWINQVRADMAGYNRAVVPGGYAREHAMTVRLWLRKGQERKIEKRLSGDVEVGYQLSIKAEKNSVGIDSREMKTFFYKDACEALDHPGYDIDEDYCTIGYCVGVVKRAGPYYEWNGTKVLGREKFFTELKEKNLFDDFKKDVQANLSQDIIEENVADLGLDEFQEDE